MAANTTGGNNTALGYSALYSNTTASSNTAVGYQAGNLVTGAGNQFFGYSSGSAVTTGAKNVIIGGYTGSAAPISATGSNYIVLSDGDGNVRGTFDSSGNLGLGVVPSAWNSSYKVMQVGVGTIMSQPGAPSVIDVYANAYIDSAFANKYISTAAASHYEQNSGQHRWWNAPSGTAGATITFTQAMTLDASGNLLVGTTATYGGPGRINVGFNQSTNFGITIRNTNAAATGIFVSFENSGGTGNGSISQASSSAVLYNTTSDYRLKNITGPITTSGAYIDSLKPVEGTWKADGSTFVGLIAHETQEASRTIVATGTKDGEQIQGMDYSSAEIIANLIAELQSLRARVASLESK
jgi:hypothetical protein